MIKYLVRLDDACPYMNHHRWYRIFEILEKNNISPLIGIIPNNNDNHTMVTPFDKSFWQNMRKYQDLGWSFALHGYDHQCLQTNGGINPVHQCSEYAGLDFEHQSKKIAEGYRIMTQNGIFPKFFFAPCHTFDMVTIDAIKKNTPIRIISDTFALKPYNRHGMTFIPQQMGRFRQINIPGVWTFCFHPNEMDDKQIAEFEDFIKENNSRFISFADLASCKCNRRRSLLDITLQKIYFLKRTI